MSDYCEMCPFPGCHDCPNQGQIPGQTEIEIGGEEG